MTKINNMTNAILKEAIQKLNEETNQRFACNSWEFGDSDKTQYGLVRQNKDGTLDQILKPEFTKKEIFYHIQGFLNIGKPSVSTKVIPKEGGNKNG